MKLSLALGLALGVLWERGRGRGPSAEALDRSTDRLLGLADQQFAQVGRPIQESLQHLDDRLDFAATQALQKWEFQPAKRDGRTVDVDAIFEIPFRLEPIPTR